MPPTKLTQYLTLISLNCNLAKPFSWNVTPGDGDGEIFVIGWRESGGPPVAAPSRRGFGSTLICRMAEANLNARVELDFAEGGLTWQLRCLAKDVTE